MAAGNEPALSSSCDGRMPRDRYRGSSVRCGSLPLVPGRPSTIGLHWHLTCEPYWNKRVTSTLRAPPNELRYGIQECASSGDALRLAVLSHRSIDYRRSRKHHSSFRDIGSLRGPDTYLCKRDNFRRPGHILSSKDGNHYRYPISSSIVPASLTRSRGPQRSVYLSSSLSSDRSLHCTMPNSR